MSSLEQRPPDKEKATLGGAAFKSNLQKEYYQKHTKQQEKFNRSALPTAEIVLKKLGITSYGYNHAGFITLCCPFHKEGLEKRASLNMHVINGHYKCHACGAKGGDVLAFYMAVTNKKFVDGARDLGAWGANV